MDRSSVRPTNPFDSFYERELHNASPQQQQQQQENDDAHSTESDDFFDCQQTQAGLDGTADPPSARNKASARVAPLDFSQAFAGPATPALTFRDAPPRSSREFSSPLKSAMLQLGDTNMHSPVDESPTPVATLRRPAPVDDNQSRTQNSPETHRSAPVDEASPLLQTDNRRFRQYSDKRNETRATSNDNDSRTVTKTNDSSAQRRLVKQQSSLRSDSIDPVLRKLDGGDPNEFNLEYKLILLEDLGTASSWLILLLPYIAFCLCLILESYRSLHVYVSPPISSSSMSCQTNFTVTTGRTHPYPIGNTKSETPCWAVLDVHEGIRTYSNVDENSIPQNENHNMRHRHFEDVSQGSIFTSGVLPDIPILSSYVHMDASFHHLPTDTVAAVAKGRILTTTLVYQESVSSADGSHGNDQWSLMFRSTPRLLTMVCKADRQIALLSASTLHDCSWNCTSPRMLDMVFAMPQTAIYSGGRMRFDTLYYYEADDAVTDGPDGTIEDGITNDNSDSRNPIVEFDMRIDGVFTFSSAVDDLLVAWNTTGSLQHNVDVLARSSSYVLEHTSQRAASVDSVVRLITLIISVVFLVAWCYFQGMATFFERCCCDGKEAVRTLMGLWWESPWIVFPERRYVLVLLFALICIQGPLLLILAYFPEFGSVYRLRLAADVMNGIGVHCTLFVYLCLFHGFRYHTADVAKKRTEHQRHVLQLRRAAKYITAQDDPSKQNDEEAISEYMRRYYDQFGDVDGSATNIHLRLQNDPCTDGSIDFLWDKALLLLIGSAAVAASAHSSFPPENDHTTQMSAERLDRYSRVYVSSSIIQLCVVIIWLILIAIAAIKTGQALRKQPFLGTRPAQLSFRIVFAHMALGFLALVVTFALQARSLLDKWSVAPSGGGGLAPAYEIRDTGTRLQILARVMQDIAQAFPYSGTAADVGAGRIIFATVSILITAFIFLPAQKPDQEYDGNEKANDKGNGPTMRESGPQSDRYIGALDLIRERAKRKKDKRTVVNLAKDTRTWRVFPVPIKPVESFLPARRVDDGILLYKDMSAQVSSRRNRGFISIGPYMPVFCLETAYWLSEASWQAYYSPVMPNEEAFGAEKMNLGSIGLRLEGAVLDETTTIQAYVGTNVAPQVDGDSDTIIVVAFRGTANAANIKTDFRYRQVPLLDQIAGIGASPFCIRPDRYEIHDGDGWIWDTPETVSDEDIQCVLPAMSDRAPPPPACLSLNPVQRNRSGDFASGAKAVLQATPVAKHTFPLVHEGFQEAYCRIRQKLLNVILPVYQRQLQKLVNLDELGASTDSDEPLALPKLYITGHSMGGSLAQLLGLDLAGNCEVVLPIQAREQPADIAAAYGQPEEEVFHLPSPQKRRHRSVRGASSNDIGLDELRLRPPIAVYTYGQPRVGNKVFSRMYKQKVPHTFRVVNEGDAITSMPHYLFCAGVYKHAGLEVLLDEGRTGNILVGPTVVETVFRFHEVRTNVSAHTLLQYRECLECAFAEHELQEYYQRYDGGKGSKLLGGGNGGGGTVKVAVPAGTPEQILRGMVEAKTAVPSWMVQVRTTQT